MEVLRKRNCSAELTCDVVYSILHPTKLKNKDILNVLCLYIVYINLDNTSRLIKVKQYIFLKFFFKISALNQVIFSSLGRTSYLSLMAKGSLTSEVLIVSYKTKVTIIIVIVW